MGQRWHQPYVIVENVENEITLANRDRIYLASALLERYSIMEHEADETVLVNDEC